MHICNVIQGLYIYIIRVGLGLNIYKIKLKKSFFRLRIENKIVISILMEEENEYTRCEGHVSC